MKAPSRFPRPSAGLLLALIGLMMGFIAPGYCQDRPASAMDATALTALPTWTPTGNLKTPRGGHTATLLPGGKVLVAGGWVDDHTPINSAELYDIATGTWSVTGSLSSAYYGHTATLLPNGKVLVVGYRVNGLFSELYDPATGTWSPNTVPPGLADAATLLPNGKVLMVWYTVTPDSPFAHLYDPATLTWLPAATPTSVRNDSTATLLQNGSVLVAGGRSDPAPGGWWEFEPEPTRAEVYDALSDSWKGVGTALILGLHTATLLPNGKVLLMGWGYGPATAKLYDPAAETFTDTGNFTVGRMCCHTATLLPNGKVLVAGGRGAGGSDPSRSAELYDRDTGMWTSTSSLNTGRHSHTATSLPDGRVLVAGGVTHENWFALNSAEIYGPALSGMPELSVAKTPDNGTFQPGAQVAFTIVVGNPAPAGAGSATNVTLTDQLPGNGGLVWSNVSTSQGSCTTPIVGNLLNCNLGTIAPQGSVTVIVSSASTTPANACQSQPNPVARVTADGGLSAQDAGSLTCTATNLPPVASFSATPSPAPVGTPITFSAAASSDPDGTITSYAWNFGDGTTGSGVSVSKSYAAAGAYTVTLTVTDNGGKTASATSTVAITAAGGGVVVWVEDAVPPGAVLLGTEPFTWVSSNPVPYSGTLAHQSALASGMHQHYFRYASTELNVAVGDSLFSYVYLDPANPPQQVMLQWNDGSWEHRAYWGANLIPWGAHYMGPLPVAGQWVRLQVPAALVGLEGRSVNGMAFTLYGGRATWDYSGSVASGANLPPIARFTTTPASTTIGSPITMSAAASSDPDGTITGYAWNFGDGTPGSGVSVSKSYAAAGTYTVTLTVTDNGGKTATTTRTVTITAAGGGFEFIWVEDAVPPGAVLLGTEPFTWVSSNPVPYSGTLAHQSGLASGMHQHYFRYASTELNVAVGDSLFSYVYLDPANLPQTVMLQWNDGSWEHRAYWGASLIPWGTGGGVGGRYMGPLPVAGQWVRLQVPAALVGLEGRSVNGMAFTLYGGRATWDYAGKISP